MKLSELKRGQKAEIKNIYCTPELKSRLFLLGAYPGAVIEFERNAPLGNPQQYLVAGNYIAFRKNEAKLIEIEVVE